MIGGLFKDVFLEKNFMVQTPINIQNTDIMQV